MPPTATSAAMPCSGPAPATCAPAAARPAAAHSVELHAFFSGSCTRPAVELHLNFGAAREGGPFGLSLLPIPVSRVVHLRSLLQDGSSALGELDGLVGRHLDEASTL